MEYNIGDLLDFGDDTEYTDKGVSLIGVLKYKEKNGTGDFWIIKHNGNGHWRNTEELCLSKSITPVILNKSLNYEIY